VARQQVAGPPGLVDRLGDMPGEVERGLARLNRAAVAAHVDLTRTQQERPAKVNAAMIDFVRGLP
jgi:hypothetical protein